VETGEKKNKRRLKAQRGGVWGYPKGKKQGRKKSEADGRPMWEKTFKQTRAKVGDGRKFPETI